MTDNNGTKVCITNGDKAASDYPVLSLNQWNNMQLVLDREKNKAATVVNGNMGRWYDFVCDSDKFGITVQGNGDKTIAIDDIHIYTSDEHALTIYPSIDKVFTVKDGYIGPEDGLTAEYILRRCELDEVIAFADDSMKQMLPSDAPLTEGNVVIIRRGEYSVAYTVGEVPEAERPDIKWLASVSDNFAGSKIAVQRAFSSTAYGVCGKNINDGVWHLRYNIAGASAGESDIYLNYNLTAEQAAGVVTFELDVYPTETCNTYRFATGTHAAICKVIEKTKLKSDSWNRIRYVYDGSSKTGKLYINDVISETVNNVSLKSNSLRFLAFTRKTEDSECYLDNINLYIGKLAQHPVTSTVYDISAGNIDVPAGTDVYDVLLNLKKRFDTYDIWVYNENGDTALNRDVVEQGMTLVVKDGNNVLRQYSID
jgi:hypothetical protein